MRPIEIAVDPPQPVPVPEGWLRSIADSALTALRMPEDAWVEVVITDDETIRDLNRRHLGVSETTDVLSFAAGGDSEGFVLPDDGGSARSIGEVVLSLPQAERQAESAGRERCEEMAFLLAHGILHLAGHDHEEPDERALMEAEHRRLLSAMLGPGADAIEVSYPT